MLVELDEKNLAGGVLSLVLALVEIIEEALRLQALRRIEGGSLTEAEIDRLGNALLELNTAIEQIKRELGIAHSVQTVRDSLDAVVEDAVERLLNPERWPQ